MIGKLFKHEFIALGRIIFPVGVVVLITSLISSLTLLIQNDSMVYTQIQIMFLSLFILADVFFVTITFILCAIRFYQSMFSKEGYMTLSLPVTSMQILWIKMAVSAIVLLFALVISVLSIEIFAVVHGFDIIGGIVEAIIGASKELPGLVGIIIYALFIALISSFSSLLFLYACMSAGQLFHKNRTLAIVGAYIIANHVLSLIFSILAVTVLPVIPWEALANANLTGTIYLLISVLAIPSLIIGVASVIFTRYILKNKVNLLV